VFDSWLLKDSFLFSINSVKIAYDYSTNFYLSTAQSTVQNTKRIKHVNPFQVKCWAFCISSCVSQNYMALLLFGWYSAYLIFLQVSHSSAMASVIEAGYSPRRTVHSWNRKHRKLRSGVQRRRSSCVVSRNYLIS